MKTESGACLGGLRLFLLAVAALHVGAGQAEEATRAKPREVSGKITQWPVPTNKMARDPAADAKGNVYFAVADGDAIARFDPETQRFTQWNVPKGTNPHGVVITADGKVYFGGRGNGSIGEIDPATGAIKVFRVAGSSSGIYSLAKDADDNIWFTERDSGRLGKLDRMTASVSTWPMSGEPYGLAQDKLGRIWVTRLAADKLGVLDPMTGAISEIGTGLGSKPRRIAVGTDGMVWVTLYGTGKLIKVDPVAQKIIKEYDVPGGSNSGPYSVTTDQSGRVWVSVFQMDTVAVLSPGNVQFRVYPLPEKKSGIRNSVIGPQGRFWYIASSTGMLGVVE